MKTIHALTLLAFLAVPLLSACNTMEGLGEDTQAAGEGLERAADDNRNY